MLAPVKHSQAANGRCHAEVWRTCRQHWNATFNSCTCSSFCFLAPPTSQYLRHCYIPKLTQLEKMHTVIANLKRPDTKTSSPPSISTRAFIQWLPDPPSEPTSTEVLTSRERFFVDIRILKEAGSSSLSSHIDWAFAGRSESSKDEATGKTLARWQHTIDSRFLADPESVVDQAEMLPEDPETGIALEKGSMVNPATGKETAYVEGWRETEVEHVPEPSRDVLEGFARDLERCGVRVVECGSERKSVVGGDRDSLVDRSLSAQSVLACCVLQHEHAARRSRGMVVRLGQFCQGVLRVGDEFAAERWEWKAQSGWEKVFAIGDPKMNMPCDVACYQAAQKLRAGNEIVYGPNETWQCVEDEQWQPVEERSSVQ